MKYNMEELAPIVGKLAEKYTSHESTSVSYEKAEQLMGAVLYCIREAEEQNPNALTAAEGMPAQRAYEIGKKCVAEKTRKALQLYNDILPGFSDYGNLCLYDTFVKGLPEFFKWYNVPFEPQNTILTLDYPVLKEISGLEGIDRIYEFILCIQLEQLFLHLFPNEYIITLLSKYNRDYKETAENLCEIVLMSVIGHILAQKPMAAFPLEEEDYLRIQETLPDTGLEEVGIRLKNALSSCADALGNREEELFIYLSGAVKGNLIRLRNAADNGTLFRMI